jgi:hypothetical protein
MCHITMNHVPTPNRPRSLLHENLKFPKFISPLYRNVQQSNYISTCIYKYAVRVRQDFRRPGHRNVHLPVMFVFTHNIHLYSPYLNVK